jgi:hypothetical protein
MTRTLPGTTKDIVDARDVAAGRYAFPNPGPLLRGQGYVAASSLLSLLRLALPRLTLELALLATRGLPLRLTLRSLTFSLAWLPILGLGRVAGLALALACRLLSLVAP